MNLKKLISKLTLQMSLTALAFFLSIASAKATTAIMLTDEDLVINSRLILIGEVQSLQTNWDPNYPTIYTYVKIQISRVIKGSVRGDSIVFKQLGGTIDGMSSTIFGTPTYRIGQKVLLFLDTASNGTLRIAHLFQGKYDLVSDRQTGEYWVERILDEGFLRILGPRENEEITNTSILNLFLKKIRKVLHDKAVEVFAYEQRYADIDIVEIPHEYVDRPAQNSNRFGIYPQFTFNSTMSRWAEPDSGQPVVFKINSTGCPVPNGGVVEFNNALSAWTNVATGTIVLQNGGATTAGGFQTDGVSALSFDDPLDQMSDIPPNNCFGGVLALGGATNSGPPTIIVGGLTFNRIYEADVVFNRDPGGCWLTVPSNIAEIACHEIGHTIGLGHSSDSEAIMKSGASLNGRGAALASDDMAGISFLYNDPNPINTYSLNINGLDEYVSVPNSSSINITGSITVEAWIRTGLAKKQDIVGRYKPNVTSGFEGGYSLRLLDDNKVRFRIFKNANNFVDVTSSSTISTNVWHHVAGVFDGSQSRIYIDGVLDGTLVSSFHPRSGTGNLAIGAAPDGGRKFGGLIDEVRVTASALYSANFTPERRLGNTTNTKGLWKFDNQTANDSSGNGNNGSLIGGPTFSLDQP